jgi:hypothetical protein
MTIESVNRRLNDPAQSPFRPIRRFAVSLLVPSRHSVFA